MVPATTKCRVLRFGVFELDLESRELRKRGIRVKLAGQSFHALLLLLERSPAVVAREELCRALWPDELWGDHDHRLNKTINRIREVLRDSAETPRFLETLPRVGYRFLAPVEPGNLLLLGYKEEIPIVSAPGCFRSAKPNVVDLILPPMLARYRVSGWEVACMGHGGLLG